jgi:hypothetical protein
MRTRCRLLLLVVPLLTFGPASGLGRVEATEQNGGLADVNYIRDVKPLLRERCFACHGALKQEGGLRLDSGTWIQQGGDSGPVIVAGDVAASYLMERIGAEDESERMPPEGAPLDDRQQELLRAWIAGGAVTPADDQPDPDPTAHWAFQTPQQISPPLVPPTSTGAASELTVRNPIDAFLAAAHTQHRLQPMPAVESSLLLRRVYLDLIGLPPTRRQLDAFLADTRPDAYERVVEQLLARPEYAERWGRHWMDVWRYSDWFGLGEQLRYSQKHIWHWRDWILESLAADKGYDRMVMEMLAGDELAPTDHQTLRATGFLARNYFLFNRTTWLDDTIEHTAKAFLGLTLNCSKCHDHKYDPISQVDYYAFRAILEPHQIRLDALPGTPDLERDGLPRAFDAHPDAVTHVHRRGDAAQPDTSFVVEPNVPEFLRFAPLRPELISLPVNAARPNQQAFFWQDLIRQATRELDAARQEQALIESTSQTRPVSELANDAERAADSTAEDVKDSAKAQDCEVSPSDLPSDASRVSELDLAAAKVRAASAKVAMLAAVERVERTDRAERTEDQVTAAARATRQWERRVAETELVAARLRQAQKPEEHEKIAGEIESLRQRRDELARKVDEPGDAYFVARASLKALEGPDETESSRFADYPSTSTGRRLALARWIVDRRNPLTARVAVNHLWMRHFGQPLVESVEDFGRQAPAPPQLALLDWLAVELMNHDWQMKPLHRLMVTSQTYRLACADHRADEATQSRDANNVHFWCRTPQRMQAQVIRDSLLHLAGQLESQFGGPTVNPRQDQPPYRRSIYFTHSRDDQHAFLKTFDDADILRCYRRQQSVVPQQALALANSRLALEMATMIADRIHRQRSADEHEGGAAWEAFIDESYQWILCRTPTAEEREACRKAIDRWTTLDGRSDGDAAAVERARRNLVHALLNVSDFVTIR